MIWCDRMAFGYIQTFFYLFNLAPVIVVIDVCPIHRLWHSWEPETSSLETGILSDQKWLQYIVQWKKDISVSMFAKEDKEKGQHYLPYYIYYLQH